MTQLPATLPAAAPRGVTLTQILFGVSAAVLAAVVLAALTAVALAAAIVAGVVMAAVALYRLTRARRRDDALEARRSAEGWVVEA